ncbi:MAG: hypothetical protein MPK05_07460 [Gammaproteobacteria bacterium]|nr:hypothetical protein [Gammaproteobacteria bacterium]
MSIFNTILEFVVGRVGAKEQRRASAAEKFRAAFVKQILALQAGKEDVFRILTEKAIEQHKMAKIQFEPYVPRRKRKSFNNAWDEYEQQCVRTKAPGSIDNRCAECAEALKQIEALFAFAKI